MESNTFTLSSDLLFLKKQSIMISFCHLIFIHNEHQRALLIAPLSAHLYIIVNYLFLFFVNWEANMFYVVQKYCTKIKSILGILVSAEELPLHCFVKWLGKSVMPAE